MEKVEFKPYVPAETNLKELTLRSLFLGVIMAVILGSANTYIGLKAGMTISATFPAAVVAMAVMRVLRGSILEENIARTTASVGEALAAGAIFTIPAFVISGVWEDFNYWESTVIMLVGGALGVLFIIILRRPLVSDATLPYPEAVACAEMVKAGQKGETGAKYVFSMMGVSALIELFKNARGIKLFEETLGKFFEFGRYKIQLFSGSNPLGNPQTYTGGIYLSTPVASPALIGVGYIIGPRLSAVAFSGGVLGWWLFIPLVMFFNNGLEPLIKSGSDWETLTNAVWYYQVRPIAVGAMIVGAFHTLWKMRKQLFQGIAKGLRDTKLINTGRVTYSRLEDDLPLTSVLIGILLLVIPVVLIYYYFTKDFLSAVVAGIVMTLTGFLFSAVAGYLVGVMGGSNNPISGLTLSSLVISAVLMVALGVKGTKGVEVVLGVAAVVCTALGIAGDMLQDLKVGQILGGTPRKMQIAEIIGVLFTALVLVFPMSILHKGTEGGIGGKYLPAPQAGLMSVMSKGIVSGEIAWPLVIFGGVLAFVLILLKSPSPTLIAVGMYLPFETTSAIFVGGLIKYLADQIVKRKRISQEDAVKIENRGILLASGLVAGESITGVLLAGLYLLNVQLPHISDNPFIGMLIFPIVAVILILVPLRSK
ncbi:putative oligopeptide transporter, OPT family [Candidatus Thermokryptus mobilis]|uniref:Putative oligopeptide transporter, OPT family n=1 Tax=Candidatus Thermokryptus mobilis TaxID=1643428 RepID=A0A0S4N8H4_9BACT|nr:oligopeptide transporter, OPT family [Candidatus Thermokryptus mobilis]CUU07317.1 putative oligopeptide transporter, OPT family [Candidatus Thermokryptus mobilis]